MTDPTPSSSTGEHFIDSPDSEAISDPRIRVLVESYTSLVGGTLTAIEPQLLELNVPPSEAVYFHNKHVIRIAFSLASLERNPDAEMAVVGSGFLRNITAAVRARGHRLSGGAVPQTFSPHPQAAALMVPVRRGQADPPVSQLAVHPLGRLVARVTLSAGSTVEEHLVESCVFDLTTGAPVSDDIGLLCEDIEKGELRPAAEGTLLNARPVAAKSPETFVPLMLGDLEKRIAPQITQRRADAERALAVELNRIDAYYLQLLGEAGGPGTEVPTAKERRAIDAEHGRRRTEEQRRHEVRAVVHPLQLVEFKLGVQRAEWLVRSSTGHSGTIAGVRPLSGSGTWSLTCPSCGISPGELLVCRRDHVSCAQCGKTCAVCGEDFCAQHGLTACHVDGQPACDAHARRCPSCNREHCSAHEGVCAETDHPACSQCLGACGSCGRQVCAAHAIQSMVSAPLGDRRLCLKCVVYCEGGTNEPVGIDEAVRCASCSKYVCGRHQATCAVDGKVHCSKHLRRSDRSRRLVCEAHQSSCSQEPGAILSSDEVGECATCQDRVCQSHSDLCAGDGKRHCVRHLAALHDTRDQMGCESHRTVCHVDERSYSLTGTSPCPICEKATCREHMRACKWCGRPACPNDRQLASGRCSTCQQLAVINEPPDTVLTAALAANEGEPARPKEWRTARDASHVVVQMDLGWTRQIVFSVRHGDTVPETVVKRSMFGSNRSR